VGHGRCKLHGGRTSSHRKAARAREVQADAKAVLAKEGVEPILDPLGKIAELAAVANAMQEALAARVNALDGLANISEDGTEQVRAVLLLWERALERTERFCADLVRLDYEGRRAALAERQSEALEAVMLAAMRHAGLAEAVQHRVLEGVPYALVEIMGVPE